MNLSSLLFCCCCIIIRLSSCTGQLVINITNNGRDQPSCLSGKSNCSTLEYSLNSFVNTSTDVTINVYYNHDFGNISNHGDNGSDLMFRNLSNIAILGHPTSNDDHINITCPHLGTGLHISHSVNITIRRLAFINCGVWHPTTANANWTSCHSNESNNRNCLVLPKAISAIFMYNCTDLTLDHTHFTSNRGSGVSLYNVIGSVNITNSVFINHTINDPILCEATPTNQSCSPQSTGIYIEFMYCPEFTKTCDPDITNITKTNYNINNCRFEDNHNKGEYHRITDIPTPMELAKDTHHWPFGRGGGLGVVLKVTDLRHFSLKVHDNVFTNNSAIYGGGMFLLLQSDFPDNNVYVIQRTDFTNNTADYNGGGLCVVIDVRYNTNITEETLTQSLRNQLYIAQSNFTRNMAYWGGGMSFTAYPLNVTYIIFRTVQCAFTGNVFSGGGGAVALLRKEKPEKEFYFIAYAEFHACNFTNTGPILAKGSSLQIMSSSVHSEGIEVHFYNVTIFKDNCATALRLSDTGAVFKDKVFFTNNTGYNGGGMSLSGKSWITLVNKLNMSFESNKAIQYGGAIYYDPAPVMNMNMTSTCFVWYYQDAHDVDIPVEDWWVNVSFTNNYAYQAGHAAYVTDPQLCVWPNQPSLFNPNRTTIFNYSGQHEEERVISTPSKCLKFRSSNKKKFTAANNSSDYARYLVMAGESLQLTLITHDSTGQEVLSTVVCVTCHTRSDYESYNHQNDACGNGTTQFGIDNYNRQVLSGSQFTDFKIYGPNSDTRNNTSNSTSNNTSNSTSELVLVFRTDDPIPVVLPLLIEFTECTNGFQYNKHNRSCECLQDFGNDLSPIVCAVNIDYAIETPCVKRGYWYGQINDNQPVYHYCHSDSCRVYTENETCEDYRGYVKLPSVNSELCANKLTGPLCSECDDGHSLSYDGYKCVKCDGPHKLGLILFILLECLAIVLIVLVFLKLNFRVSTSSFYGFLYFYSILKLLLWIPLPTGLDAIIGAIVGVTSLDFQLLQYTEMCFSDFRAIHYEALHYVYPITVMIMIFTVIKIDQSGWRRSQFFTGESSIQALCIILLIIYTSVSETSLNIILPLQYHSPNGDHLYWYVHADPGLRYMDPRHHLPFWLLAVSVQLLLVLPFSLLMFFAPWVMRCINLSKIKPILDEYQNCFHDNHRWYAGVYLLARQVMYLISGFVEDPELTAYLQQIFCLSLLILAATLHPYRNKVHNVIDIMLLSLLTFMTFTTAGSNGRHVYYRHNKAQVAVVGIACITPCVVMVTVILVMGIYKFCSKLKQFRRFKMQSVITDTVNAHDSQASGTDDTMSLWTTGSSSTRYQNTYDDDDLPPRFYDEERIHTRREEKTPLIHTTNSNGNQGTVSAQYQSTVVTREYSINNKPATN